MNSKKIVLTVLATAAVLCSPIARADGTNSAKSKLDELFPDVTVAKGKGIDIKRSRLDEEISGYKSAAAARGMELTPRDLPFIEKRAYDHLVELTLVTALANDAERAKGGEIADKQIEGLKKQAPSLDAFDLQLKAMGLTTNELRARLLDEAIMAEVLRDKVKVSDDDVKKFFDDNPSKFEEPEKAHVMHILFLTSDRAGTPISPDEKKAKMKKAQDAVTRARAGEDFGKLVDEYSEDPRAKDGHGDISIPRNTGRVPKQFEAAAFSLSPGQVSEVITSDIGIHVIKSIERVPSKKIGFDTVKADIRTYLENNEIAKILPTVVEPLKKAADIQILDEQLKNSIRAAEEATKKVNDINAEPLKPGEKKEDPASK